MAVPDAAAPPIMTLPSRPVRHLPTSVDEATSVRVFGQRTLSSTSPATLAAEEEPDPVAPVAIAVAPITAETPIAAPPLSPSPQAAEPVPAVSRRRWPIVLAIVGGSLGVVIVLGVAVAAAFFVGQWALGSLGGLAGLPIPPTR
jgi:hypothetical protein